MKWFKFYGQDYLSDPKTLSLSASERSCWITLLSYSSINDNGMITFLSEDQLMIQAGVSPQHEEWGATLGILKKLVKLGMIEIDNEVITVKNWKKRQETNLTSYERVKRFREKKQTDNAKITLEENRRDKKRIDKTKTITPVPQDGTDPTLVSEIINHFKEVNPSYDRLFGMPPQRAAVDRLLKKFGKEKLISMLVFLPKSNASKYAPTITTPVQFEQKLGELVAWGQKQKDIKKTKVAFT